MADRVTDLLIDIPEHLRPVLFRALRNEADRLVDLAATEQANLDAEEARVVDAGLDELALMGDPLFGWPTIEETRARAQAEIGALRVRHHEAQSKADVLIGTGRTPSDLDRAWDAALADAVKGIQAARAEADAQARARAARAGEAEGMTWQAMAEMLWGPNWVTPLAVVARNNKRTLERANAAGKPPDWIKAWLAETMARVPEDVRRAYGLVMRGAMMAQGGPEAFRLASVDVETGRLP